jgi:hypothetical protein
MLTVVLHGQAWWSMAYHCQHPRSCHAPCLPLWMTQQQLQQAATPQPNLLPCAWKTVMTPPPPPGA